MEISLCSEWRYLQSSGAVGDIVAVSLSGQWVSGGAVNGTLYGILDVASWVNAAAVTYWSGGTATTSGVASWLGGPGHESPIAGEISKALVAGDISAGNVTFRLLGRLYAAGSRSVYADAGDPLIIMVKNFGQPVG